MLKLVFLKHNLVFFIFLIEEKQRQEKKGKKKEKHNKDFISRRQMCFGEK